MTALHKDMDKVLIPRDQLQARITEIAAELSRDYVDKFPLFIGILKGCVMFYTDLVRQIDTEIEMEFMAISSYGSGTTSGEVRLLKDVDVSVKDRHVVIVEDIVDTGVTLTYLLKLLKARGVKSVEIATLLSKEARRKLPLKVKYMGFDIPDEFVVGYGLDYNEKYRTLPDIYILKPSVFKGE